MAKQAENLFTEWNGWCILKCSEIYQVAIIFDYLFSGNVWIEENKQPVFLKSFEGNKLKFIVLLSSQKLDYSQQQYFNVPSSEDVELLFLFNGWFCFILKKSATLAFFPHWYIQDTASP